MITTRARTRLAIAAAAVLTLAACGGQDPAPAAPAPAPVTAAQDPEDAYWDAVRDGETIALAGRPAAVEFGETVCRAVREGRSTRDDAVQSGIDADIDPVEAAQTVDAALEHLCPR